MPPFGMTRDHEDAADPHPPHLAEDARRGSFELGDRQRNGAREPPGPGADSVGEGRRDHRIDPFREPFGGELGLDLVCPQGKVGTVSLERPDGHDHERVRAEARLPCARIDLCKATPARHCPSDPASVFNAPSGVLKQSLAHSRLYGSGRRGRPGS